MLTLSKNTVHPDGSAIVPSNRTPTLPALRHPPCHSHSPVPRRLRPDDLSILFQHLPIPVPLRHTSPAGSIFHRLNKRLPSCPIRKRSDLFTQGRPIDRSPSPISRLRNCLNRPHSLILYFSAAQPSRIRKKESTFGNRQWQRFLVGTNRNGERAFNPREGYLA
jgi:hypothetical protein